MFSTIPNNPFPPSTAQMNSGDNAEIQEQIDAVKDGTTIDSFGDVEIAMASKANNVVIASEFDAEAGIYSVGDFVMYEGKLYEFITEHETAGDWNSEEVTEKNVADELSSLESGLTNVKNQLFAQNTPVFFVPNWRGGQNYNEIILNKLAKSRCGFLLTKVGIFPFQTNANGDGFIVDGGVSLTITNEGNNKYRFACAGDWYTTCLFMFTWDYM